MQQHGVTLNSSGDLANLFGGGGVQIYDLTNHQMVQHVPAESCVGAQFGLDDFRLVTVTSGPGRVQLWEIDPTGESPVAELGAFSSLTPPCSTA